jgi:hypothetical protein
MYYIKDPENPTTKAALGLVVKRKWDEEAVTLKYAANDADDF